MPESIRQRAQAYFESLQESICLSLINVDGAVFRQDLWQHEQGGGGRTRVMTEGTLFERAGVNFSAVQGHLPDSLARKLGGGEERDFFATGISLVIHPRNPYIPAVHMNYRYLERGARAWFGGGSDLTPFYPFREDVIHFHRTLKAACDRHDPDYYPRFKAWCDDYFYIKHRNEPRGVGGIFFDYLEGDMEALFRFVQSAGECFLSAFLPIVKRRKELPWGDRERKFQLYRRGRYVEFNLVYDRGTLFGLATQGRIESILMSLPPLVRWEYDWQPEPGSREEELYTDFLPPRDWVED